MLGHPQTGFVVLPDNDATGDVTGRLLPWGDVVTMYPSGRPWIIGNCWDRPVLVHDDVVVLGHTSVTRDQVARHGNDPHRLLDEADGAFHAAVLIGHEVHVRGSAYGVCRLYTCVVDGVTLVSDRTDVLQRLSGADVDVNALAGHLLEPIPHWLGEQPLLTSVEPVPPTHHVVLTPDGRSRLRPSRRRRPEPSLGLRDGAELVRERLAAAVATRTDSPALITSELSGGYDSTSVSYLAARGKAEVVLVTAAGRDSTSEDLRWAERAAAGLPELDHVVLPTEDLPFTYAGLAEPGALLDEPCTAVPGRERVLALVRKAAARGSTLHLTGHGGDHLFTSLPTPFHDLFRTRPVAALRQLRAFSALAAWPTSQLMRELADRRDHRTWWRAHARPQTGQPDPHSPMLGWAIPPTVPAWVTADGVRAIERGILEMAERAEPLGRARGEHAERDSIFEGARMARGLNRMATHAGVPLAAPFHDDRVVEACLSVRPEERISAWQYKPLLNAAMQGVVPSTVLDRSAKDDGSIDVAYGLQEHRDELVALWESSRLAETGLIDAGMLRRLCAQPSSRELEHGSLYATIACELWLRGLDQDRTQRY